MVTIRKAASNDVLDLVWLNREVQGIHCGIAPLTFRETNDEEVATWLLSQIDEVNVLFFVAEVDNKVMGYLIVNLIILPANPFMHERKYAHIDHICVGSSARGKGVGRRLIEHAIEIAKGQELDYIELMVWSDNENAKLAFKKLGFINCREHMRLSLALA